MSIWKNIKFVEENYGIRMSLLQKIILVVEFGIKDSVGDMIKAVFK